MNNNQIIEKIINIENIKESRFQDIGGGCILIEHLYKNDLYTIYMQSGIEGTTVLLYNNNDVNNWLEKNVEIIKSYYGDAKITELDKMYILYTSKNIEIYQMEV